MNPLNILFQCSFVSSILLLLLFSLSTSTTLTFDDCKSLTDNEEDITYLPDEQYYSSSPFDNSSLTIKPPDTIVSEIIASEFAYLMKLCVNTSGGYETTYAIPDTGSDIIWLNSEDCRGESCHCDTTTPTPPPLGGKCIKEDKNLLIKCNDKKHCDKKQWEDLKIPINCPSHSDICKYKISYGDNFSTEGVFSIGNFKFVVKKEKDQNVSPYEEPIMFGVSKKSEGPLEKQSKGVVGLGLGSLSLIRQFSLVQKFSYCLQHPESKTKRKFSFGSAVKTDHDKFTHLLGKHEGGGVCEFRYCVHLSTISFNGGRHDNERITVNEKNKHVMVVDSGATFTSLANGLFDDEFLKKVKLAIGGDNEPIPINDHYQHCFVEESAKKLDKVTFVFGVGVGVGESKNIDVELKRENFFDEVTHDDGHGGGKRKYLCLTVKNADGHNILGSRAQMDFLVAFDTTDKSIGGMKVSFEKDCGGKQINNGGDQFEALL